MSVQKIYADFHNADEQGRLRLNCIGTIEDLERQNICLNDGKKLTFYSEDLEVDGIVKYSSDENIWTALINWNSIQVQKEEAIIDNIETP